MYACISSSPQLRGTLAGILRISLYSSGTQCLQTSGGWWGLASGMAAGHRTTLRQDPWEWSSRDTVYSAHMKANTHTYTQ